MNCIYRSFKADPRNENRRNSNVSPVVVGHHIEISNRFLHDLNATTKIAKQCKAKPCHKSPFAKGGFRGNVNMIEDTSPPPRYHRGQIIRFALFFYGSGGGEDSNGCSRSADSL